MTDRIPIDRQRKAVDDECTKVMRESGRASQKEYRIEGLRAAADTLAWLAPHVDFIRQCFAGKDEIAAWLAEKGIGQ